ncbi:PRA1 family protein B4-like [Arachis stenosperma]|uniref:PRA1 family protein B4-like n=1 Tax=Arachis stenosperma TaxID=217475 RepID=UPI0025ACAF45|nr:PRA1 family protein B4-like [Arachis stenosperma]
MSSTAPPVLPISSHQLSTQTTTAPTVASAVSGPESASSTAALRSFIGRLTDSLRHGLDQRRPWVELVDRTAFSKPESFSDATVRVRKNYSYFRVNYYAVVAVILAVSLLTNPFSLVVLVGLLAAWTFLYLFRPSDQPVVLFGRTFSDFETLAMLSALTVFSVFLTSVGSVIISALMVGVTVVCLHGAFRQPEDLFLDEQEPSQATGFLSFLRGAAANAAVASATSAVPSRV